MPISFSLLDIIDILIIAFISYHIILLIKDTPAVQLIKGLVILFIVSFIADQLGLRTINWLLKGAMAMMVVALPIIFQPEIRRGLLKMGKKGFFINTSFLHKEVDKKIEQLINGLVMVMPMLSSKHKGGFINNRYPFVILFLSSKGILDNTNFSSSKSSRCCFNLKSIEATIDVNSFANCESITQPSIFVLSSKNSSNMSKRLKASAVLPAKPAKILPLCNVRIFVALAFRTESPKVT